MVVRELLIALASLAVARGPRALWLLGSVAVTHGLSCSAACGIFLDQESNTRLLHWQVEALPLHHQGSAKHHF